jgi:glutamate synthase (NADPH/NADH) small chain
MEAEGVTFRTSTRIGNARFAFGTSGEGANIIEAKQLEKDFDLILLCIGAREPREIDVPGRELPGIVQALDYLSLQNRILAGDETAQADFDTANAFGKRVLVIGGGDTGSDCVGTAHRQGATHVTQIEVMPKPPLHRPDSQPWPLWPTLFKTSSSHLEGCERLWSVSTKSFEGNGKVEMVRAVRVDWPVVDGRPKLTEVPGSEFVIGVDLVLLAMGFVHVVQDGVVKDLELATDIRGNIRTRGSFHTSNPKVWAGGDAKTGASLVVRAMADGKAAAEMIISKNQG